MLKRLLKNVGRNLGVEVQRLKYSNTERSVLECVLKMLRPAAVLDVGANVGQFALSLRESKFNGPIISFEALPAVHEQLSLIARKDPSWTIAPCAAIGSRAGNVEINVAANSVSSSVLGMCSTHEKVAPDSAYIDKQAVPLRRLDELAKPLVPAQGNLYLKVDTQGYEREVLEGSTGILDRVVAIQSELSLTPLYATAPTISEMILYIEALNFEIFNLVPGYKDLRTGRVVQVDGFFVRKGLM